MTLRARRFVSASSLLLAASLASGLSLSACGQSSEGNPAESPPIEEGGVTDFISHVPGESGGRGT
ncbi:MAG TPA: hypothetical protein VFU02_13725, partial [Polyangiaceae bacterium]|nr:hypothetical protein [Polyangiaceae bacterium]